MIQVEYSHLTVGCSIGLQFINYEMDNLSRRDLNVIKYVILSKITSVTVYCKSGIYTLSNVKIHSYPRVEG